MVLVKNIYMQRGYTIIELLIVVVLISILAVFSTSSFIDYRNEQIHRTSVLEVSTIIKETRLKTVSSETIDQFGVHIATSSVVVFEGTPFNIADVDNQTFLIPGATLGVTLSDASSEIVFTRLTGVPSATGTIDVVDKKLNSTTTLTIGSSGLIE